ncbi:MAG: hypothetical protein LUE93_13390 [Bacteroides sp.]|nr:hypothetical protein [Bacteroides sp.]
MKKQHDANADLSRHNYNELLNTLEAICTRHPGINSYLNNRYSANGAGDIHYPALCVTPGEIRLTENTNIYNFNLLYVDRLTESRDNLVTIHSIGITTLTELVNAFREHVNSFDTTGATLHVFQGQFADETVGVVANIELTTVADLGACEWFYQ